MSSDTILDVRNLKTYFYLREGVLKAVDNLSFSLEKGTVLGIVGESGCGKSITARSILRMVKSPGRSEGEINFNNNGQMINLLDLDPRGKEIRKIRGDKITMIFQEPMNALSPVHTIGDQIMEAILLHRELDQSKARGLAVKLLGDVGISNPGQRIDEYPHQLSGGMRQRAMIAIAISCNPVLLLADEPTTALDVSVQAQILSLLKGLQADYGMSIVFITHDLAVVAQMVDRVLVMYLGQVMEEANVKSLFHDPVHPYTRKLLESIPDLSKKHKTTRLETIEGSVPEPMNLPERCVFYNRCPLAENNCNEQYPPMLEVKPGHRVKCLHVEKGGEKCQKAL